METNIILMIVGAIVLLAIFIGAFVYFTQQENSHSGEGFASKSTSDSNTWDDMYFYPDTVEKNIAYKAYYGKYDESDFYGQYMTEQEMNLAKYYLKRAVQLRTYIDMLQFWEMYPSINMKPDDNTVMPESDYTSFSLWISELEYINKHLTDNVSV